MELGDRVRIRREELGLTQTELAKRMGYTSKHSVSKIENGRPCTQKIIVRLADALGVTPAYLMGWEEEEEERKRQLPEDGKLSDVKQALIELVMELSDEEVELVLRLLRR